MKLDGLPDDLNEHPFVKDSPDLTALVKAGIHAQQLIGNSIRIPSENASEADRTEFRSKLEKVGMVPKDKFTEYVRPEKPELYVLTDPPKNAETVVTQTDIDGWKKWAHEQGLAPSQFNAFAQAQIKQRLDAAEQQRQQFAQVDDVLKGKYGEAGLNSAKERALAAALRFGGKELADRLAASPDPHALIALSEVGKLFQERGMGDLTPQPKFIETPLEAETKLAEIMGNKDHPFHKRFENRRAYEAAAAEVMRLRTIALGQKPLAAGEDYVFEKEAS